MTFELIGPIIGFVVLLLIVGTVDYRLRKIEEYTRKMEAHLASLVRAASGQKTK